MARNRPSGFSAQEQNSLWHLAVRFRLVSEMLLTLNQM